MKRHPKCVEVRVRNGDLSSLSLSLDRSIEHVHGPSDTWEALQWAAETLVLTYVIGLSEVRKGFGGGLFTKIPEIPSKKIAK